MGFSPKGISLAVEELDPEKIGIEEILVSKEVEFFIEQHIQNPPKSNSGKLFYCKLQFPIKMYTELNKNAYLNYIVCIIATKYNLK